MTRQLAKRLGLLAALGFVFALLAAPAQAGVATSGAVLLDPFDPVPEIQFHHFGGYGCSYGCGGCEDSCGYARYDGCNDGCRRHYRHRASCDDDCNRGCRDRCERGCDHDCDHAADDHTCASSHCYDAQHYERRWRDGDRVGQEWEDSGRRERVLQDDGHGNSWYGRSDYDWHDDDDNGPPGADHHDHDHDHDHDGH